MLKGLESLNYNFVSVLKKTRVFGLLLFVRTGKESISESYEIDRNWIGIQTLNHNVEFS